MYPLNEFLYLISIRDQSIIVTFIFDIEAKNCLINWVQAIQRFKKTI